MTRHRHLSASAAPPRHVVTHTRQSSRDPDNPQEKPASSADGYLKSRKRTRLSASSTLREREIHRVKVLLISVVGLVDRRSVESIDSLNLSLPLSMAELAQGDGAPRA
jgi:hypothetical protein